jgi:hypothetical protein
MRSGSMPRAGGSADLDLLAAAAGPDEAARSISADEQLARSLALAERQITPEMDLTPRMAMQGGGGGSGVGRGSVDAAAMHSVEPNAKKRAARSGTPWTPFRYFIQSEQDKARAAKREVPKGDQLGPVWEKLSDDQKLAFEEKVMKKKKRYARCVPQDALTPTTELLSVLCALMCHSSQKTERKANAADGDGDVAMRDASTTATAAAGVATKTAPGPKAHAAVRPLPCRARRHVA